MLVFDLAVIVFGSIFVLFLYVVTIREYADSRKGSTERFSAGIIFLTAVLLNIGMLFFTAYTASEAKVKEEHITVLNYMVEHDEVDLVSLDGNTRYVLKDSTKTQLFDHLMEDIRESNPEIYKEIEQEK